MQATLCDRCKRVIESKPVRLDLPSHFLANYPVGILSVDVKIHTGNGVWSEADLCLTCIGKLLGQVVDRLKADEEE